MRRNHKPIYLNWLQSRFNQWYVEHFIRPQFDALGKSPMVVRPGSCEIHGLNISAGDFLHLISHPSKPVRFTTWGSKQDQGAIHLGNYCLISPGVELSAAQSIQISDNCMIAAETVISDCDWHGTYNRLRPFRCTQPVSLQENVWVGMRSIICKGVTIGENSIIGAGSVVTKNIPANVIAAGNPAKIIKEINPNRKMLKRDYLFKNGDEYWQHQLAIEKYLAADNSLFKWLRSRLSPTRND